MQITFHADQFKPRLSPEKARALFKQSVNYIEIETFTFCNRKCWFCPNAEMPFRQDKAGNQYMDEQLYLRILSDLRSVEYEGQIQFGRYNEPLADRVILKNIKLAREHCPKSWIYTHTNGDYLTRDYLDELSAAGLSRICLQTYLGNDDRYDEARIVARQEQQLRKLGLKIKQTLFSAPNVRHFHLTDYPGLQLTIDARNFDEIGSDRGGLVKLNVAAHVRTDPCMLPFTSMYIDWTGDTVPCCNIRSDSAQHRNYIVSKLQDGTSLFDAYVALWGWRKELMRFGAKRAPCDTCDHEIGAIPPANAPRLDEIYQQMTRASADPPAPEENRGKPAAFPERKER
jgi:hypothetical protein